MTPTKHVNELDDDTFKAYLKEFVDDAIRRIGNTNRAFVEQKRAERAEAMVERLIEAGEGSQYQMFQTLIAEWQANPKGDSNV